MDFRNCLGMIRSVSTFSRSSGATRPRCVVKACMLGLLLESAHVDEMAGHGGSRSHGGADQMGASPLPLAPLEVAVRSRGTALARLQPVGVHGQAHRAARFPPLEACLQEDAVQAFLFGLLLDQPGSR